MGELPASGWSRREFVNTTALLALSLGLPVAAVRSTPLAEEDVPTDRQSALMADVSQLVIPASATPGAGDVGAGNFAILALARRLDRARAAPHDPASYARFLRRDGSVRHVAWLESELNIRAKGDFSALPRQERLELLASLDTQAFATRESDSPWKAIKGAILTGYYTSEIGASQELRYEPVPGRFDPDLPLTSDFRAISNDWTAVEFG
jgi:hypothetical protein